MSPATGGRQPARHRFASWIGVAIALAVPAALTAAGPKPHALGPATITDVLLNEALMWGLALLVLAIVLFWERRTLASIGLGRLTGKAVLVGVGVTFVLMALALVGAVLVQEAGAPIEGGDQEGLVLGLPGWLQAVVALSAGFTEEILFRGYAIERLTELTRSRLLGALVPVVVFGAVHAPFWGMGHAIVAGLSGLWLTLLYLWRRNLWTNITAHALLDGLAFFATDMAASGASTTH